MLLWFIKERFLWYQIQISMGRSCKDVRPFSTLQRPLCSIPHCTGHADRIATKAYVWSLSVTFAWMPLTHACAGAHALKCNSVIFNASSCSLYPICTAVLPPKAGCYTPPTTNTRAHTHVHSPPYFHNIHGSSIPSAPSPHVHTARRPLCHPLFPAWQHHRPPSHNIHAHAPHTFIHSSACSALCWQRCLSNVSLLMHNSHVPAWYLHSDCWGR